MSWKRILTNCRFNDDKSQRILEEFINCKDFIECGHSIDINKFRGTKKLHRISVLPLGARRKTYYKMVTEFDERMIDKSILKEN